MKEMDTLRSILALSYGGVRLFRNNTGSFWAGKAERLQSGDVVIRNGRPVDCGLCVGSSDLIGWSTVEITPEMVGRRVAVFTAIEVKSAAGRLSPMQAQFLKVVRDMGGLSGVAKSAEDAAGIIGGTYYEPGFNRKK